MKSNAGCGTRSSSQVARRLAAPVVAVAALMAPHAGVAAAAPDAVAANPGPSCPDVQVVFARGTFEAPGVGATGQAFVDALNARLPGENIAVHGVNYPASLDFGAAANGIVDASSEVESVAANCPNTKIVLGGYSQGAAVAAYTTTDTVPAGFNLPDGITGPMPSAVASHVSAVVLFGTPDPWFLHLVDNSAPPITIGSLYTMKTIQLCNQGDPVCFPGGLDRSAHSAYKDNGMADEAAAFAANLLAPASSSSQPTDAPV